MPDDDDDGEWVGDGVWVDDGVAVDDGDAVGDGVLDGVRDADAVGDGVAVGVGVGDGGTQASLNWMSSTAQSPDGAVWAFGGRWCDHRRRKSPTTSVGMVTVCWCHPLDGYWSDVLASIHNNECVGVESLPATSATSMTRKCLALPLPDR